MNSIPHKNGKTSGSHRLKWDLKSQISSDEEYDSDETYCNDDESSAIQTAIQILENDLENNINKKVDNKIESQSTLLDCTSVLAGSTCVEKFVQEMNNDKSRNTLQDKIYDKISNSERMSDFGFTDMDLSVNGDKSRNTLQDKVYDQIGNSERMSDFGFTDMNFSVIPYMENNNVEKEQGLKFYHIENHTSSVTVSAYHQGNVINSYKKQTINNNNYLDLSHAGMISDLKEQYKDNLENVTSCEKEYNHHSFIVKHLEHFSTVTMTPDFQQIGTNTDKRDKIINNKSNAYLLSFDPALNCQAVNTDSKHCYVSNNLNENHFSGKNVQFSSELLTENNSVCIDNTYFTNVELTTEFERRVRENSHEDYSDLVVITKIQEIPNYGHCEENNYNVAGSENELESKINMSVLENYTSSSELTEKSNCNNQSYNRTTDQSVAANCTSDNTESNLSKGLSENLISIFQNNRNFTDFIASNKRPLLKRSVCSPPYSLNKPQEVNIIPQPKVLPMLREKKKHHLKRELPLRNCTFAYKNSRIFNDGHLMESTGRIHVNHETDGERFESVKKQKQRSKNEHLKKIKTTTCFKQKRKNVNCNKLKEQSHTKIMELEEMKKGLADVQAKTFRFLNGEEELSSDQAFQMLSEVLHTIENLKVLKREMPKKHVKENINKEIKKVSKCACNLARIIDKIIHHLDETEVQGQQEDSNNDDECFLEVEKNTQKEYTSILKNTENCTINIVPDTKHITFSEEVEYHYLSCDTQSSSESYSSLEPTTEEYVATNDNETCSLKFAEQNLKEEQCALKCQIDADKQNLTEKECNKNVKKRKILVSGKPQISEIKEIIGTLQKEQTRNTCDEKVRKNINIEEINNCEKSISTNPSQNVAEINSCEGSVSTNPILNVAEINSCEGSVSTNPNLNVAEINRCEGSVSTNPNLNVAEINRCEGSVSTNPSLNVAEINSCEGSVSTNPNLNVAEINSCEGSVSTNSSLNVAEINSCEGSVSTNSSLNVSVTLHKTETLYQIESLSNVVDCSKNDPPNETSSINQSQLPTIQHAETEPIQHQSSVENFTRDKNPMSNCGKKVNLTTGESIVHARDNGNDLDIVKFSTIDVERGSKCLNLDETDRGMNGASRTAPVAAVGTERTWADIIMQVKYIRVKDPSEYMPISEFPDNDYEF